uniref:NADH-ubiquinone oxidoreductase chain 6 n=1 Tax=Staphylinidae sp. BMNH 1274698 TaxID=1796596 RepID=A0A126TEA5_9COLE|nr:NADH dehydrogenase subunit 6 [Staphylinidae sp. BMNH 1274698]
MLMMISMMMSIMFLFMNHPMTMGLTLLIQTILISLISGMLTYNFWFSYMLFLIMVGGLLILFIYMTSIASNEMFNYSSNIMIFMSFIMFSIMLIYLINDQFLYNLNFTFNENLNLLINNNYLKKFFNYPAIIIILMMMIYLFITLIATVKITKIEYGPLRQLY